MTLRTLALALASTATFLTLAACSAETVDPEEPTLAGDESSLTGAYPVGTPLRTTGEVNHRAQATTASAILQVIPAGTEVLSASKEPKGGWYGITYKGKTGWVSGNYLTKSTGGGGGNPLAVPYLNQYDDATVNPGGSCGNTSVAMMLRYYGGTERPDGVRAEHDGGGDCGGAKPWQCPEGISRILRAEGLQAKMTRTASRATIKRQIDAGRPVIIHGYFTGVGHIMVVTGYDDARGEWIVNDPSGRWCGGVGGGYSSCGGAYDSGKARRYSYASFSNGVLGADGDIWMTTASKTAFSL